MASSPASTPSNADSPQISPATSGARHGGDLVGQVLKNQGVRFLFTLCGGHISPILVGAKRLGVRVIDVRHEVNAVFAADAVARLTGVPGVAAVTAGPGATNTITAIKNAQMAQSPLVLLGGATATFLEGRGSLQDIDQMALFKPHVKWAASARRVRDLVPMLERAFRVAQAGVPGPVFLECPVDLLYDEPTVRSLYPFQGDEKPRGFGQKMAALYVNRHLNKLFKGAFDEVPANRQVIAAPQPREADLEAAFNDLAAAERPLLILGSQATLRAPESEALAEAVERLGVPVYLGGMSRGLLGAGHPLHMRHKRRKALKDSDLVILAGFPMDFRLDYGRSIPSRTKVISINRCRKDLYKNRRPTLAVQADPGLFLETLASQIERDGDEWTGWVEQLRARDQERDDQIAEQRTVETEHLNPLDVCHHIDQALADDSVLVADGGDFVGTASYITRPRGPLRWLDPGAFGTLGVGAGFALGAKLVRPEAEVWILYGDGSCGYSIAEYDTFVRHNLPVISVVGNDACWMQIAREQVEILEDDVGCGLARSDYHRVVEGFGAKGLMVNQPDQLEATFAEAKRLNAAGHPVLVNAWLGKTDFRKGSISM
ncbi:MAG: thiamine pyrophosphate-binding protein [Acidobacteriota bacterium]